MRGRPPGRPFACSAWRIAAALSVALAVAACSAPRTGRVTLRLTIQGEDLHGFRSIALTPESASVNRGFWRDGNRTPLGLSARAVRLPAAQGQPVEVAHGALPAGRYDRVAVESSVVSGERPDGTWTPIFSHIEPIARGFDLKAGDDLTIDIVLVVMPGVVGSNGPWEIFVKDARLAAP